MTPEIDPCLPEWITIDYIQDKLVKRCNDKSIRVTKISGKSQTGKGENYTSAILRIRVSYVSKTIVEPKTDSFVIKMTFQGEGIEGQVLGQYNVIQCEIDVYRYVMPKFDELMKEIGDDDQIFAKTLYVDDKQGAIIFDDLVARDFALANRVARLDIKHVHLALRKLAKIHACGAVLNERDPEFFKMHKFDHGFYNRHTEGFKPMMCGIIAGLSHYVNSRPDLKEKYGKKCEGLVDRIMEDTVKCFDPDDRHFMTFAHGDYWTNNMMFQYPNGIEQEPSDVCPLDLQLCVWGHPAIDLHYFFNTSLKEDLRLNKQQEFIKYYYDILKSTLEKLKFKGRLPTLFQFNLEVQSRKFLAINASFVFQALMLNTNTEHAEFSTLVNEKEVGIKFKDSLYFDNEVMQKTVELLLPIYDNLGLLDPLE
ncbi:uncharacterized protein ACRADG_011833 [Cochliomyia hominivorax]